MNCTQVQRLFDESPDAGGGLSADVRDHLASCAACRGQLRAAALLRERLRRLPAPLPPEGFAGRVLSGAHRAQRMSRRRRAVPYALAASLALALGIGWLLRAGVRPPSSPASSQVVTVQGGQVQPVRLVFNSPSSLSGVTLRVGLPEGVELAEYPGMHELSWQADLKSGANLLVLPVVVHGRGGLLTASVSYGAERRQFSVLVQSASPASRAAPPPGAGTVATGTLHANA